LLQLSLINAHDDEEDIQDEQAEKVDEEARRVIQLKAVETFLEAAPQLVLQIYIAYRADDLLKREQVDKWFSVALIPPLV